MVEVVSYLKQYLSDNSMVELMRKQLEKDFYGATFQEVVFDGASVEDLVLQVRQEIQRIVMTDASKFSNLL